MRVEYPQAYRFILQEDLILLPQDRLAVSDITPEDKEAQLPISPDVVSLGEFTDNQTPKVSEQQTTANPAAVQTIKQTENTGFKYLGSNQKQFLILVNYANEEYIAAGHLTALESILARKGLTLKDVAIQNLNSIAPVKLSDLVSHYNPTRLLIMGEDALPQGIGNLPLNKPVQGKKIHVLYSFSFDEMMSSNDNKKAFWEQMKSL
ncbi:hypothetical protein FPZ42_03305 [Mucilaginibacter achroorhodeus]|uniref:Uncharacterized protein n=1 Tax=Mucilaginibacter achroorhodeus TaxID=2599294 RepID=A0A563UA78_9SPHI|nr:hypothetical protein [Mucilaginibacter achroorhodeus]TWR28255.1 hypothetical protein FPZ42_03305 [Mucilaginibacter achroorhodeus]